MKNWEGIIPQKTDLLESDTGPVWRASHLLDDFFYHDGKEVSDEKRDSCGFLLEIIYVKAEDRFPIPLSFTFVEVNLQYRQKTEIVSASINYVLVGSGDKAIILA